MLVKDLLDILESLAPRRLALEWDNCGLQVGDPGAKVANVALALDPTTANVKQALKLNCQLLITHHPLIFGPVKNISKADPAMAPVFAALSGGLAVACAHTNWDAVGVAQALAEKLELKPLGPLESHPEPLSKLVVFVPEKYAPVIRKAAFKAGAGVIGDYPECFFQAPGVGGFKVPAWGKPFSGTPGKSEQTPEVRLEMVAPRALAAKAAAAAIAAHPYEEPAVEIYDIAVPGRGFGLLGLWEPAREPRGFLRSKLGPEGLWAGPAPKEASLVALMPGSGGGSVSIAASAGADLLVAGEAGHHHALLAAEASLPLFLAGHFQTERPSVEKLGASLASRLDRSGLAVENIMILEEEPPLRRL